MKLPKSLLGAILLGVSIQVTQSSCSKDDRDLNPQPLTEQPGTENEPGSYHPDNCPACGMG